MEAAQQELFWMQIPALTVHHVLQPQIRKSWDDMDDVDFKKR